MGSREAGKCTDTATFKSSALGEVRRDSEAKVSVSGVLTGPEVDLSRDQMVCDEPRPNTLDAMRPDLETRLGTVRSHSGVGGRTQCSTPASPHLGPGESSAVCAVATTTNGWCATTTKSANPTSVGPECAKKTALSLGLDHCTAATSNANSQTTSPLPIGNEPLAQLLITLKKQNKDLIREIEDLRIKLEDAEGDLKLVRCQMRSMSKHMDTVVIESNRDRMVDETILGQLDFYKEKVILLERDIQSLLDEKEELVMSRDDLSLKNDRLNEHLISLMRNLSGHADHNYAEANSFDVDALYLENRYLKEKVKNEEDEKRLLLDRLTKYKELMDQHQHRPDNCTKKYFGKSLINDTLDPSLTTLQLPGGHVVNARDIERLIHADSIQAMEVNKANQLYLWNLLVAMFDGLQTKSMNLVHARKTNRLLGKRVEELEAQHLPPTFDLENRFTRGQTNSALNRSVDAMTRAAHTDGLSTPDPLDTTDGNTSTPMAKETSEEDENDDLSSTGISTPSTARHSMSIEQHLQALQNDALRSDLVLRSLARPSPNHHYEFNKRDQSSGGSLFN